MNCEWRANIKEAVVTYSRSFPGRKTSRHPPS